MTLIYSYSNHIGDYTDTEHILKIYKVSMLRAKKLGYSIKLYGCNFTLNFLEGFYDSCVNVNNIEFLITDDLKMYIHSVEPAGAITFDGDIILNSNLHLDMQSDIIFERKEKISPSKFQNTTIILNALKKYRKKLKIKHFNFNTRHFYNVGILRFKSEEIKNRFVSLYFKFRDYYISSIEPKENLIKNNYIVSVVISQYYFTCICNALNLNINFTINYKDNDYRHLFGTTKYVKANYRPLFDELDLENKQKTIL
jgi:hypothetical protein